MKFLFISLFYLLLFSTFSFADTYRISASRGVWMHSSPDASRMTRIGALPEGAFVSATGRVSGHWMEVSANGTLGWISRGKNGQLLSAFQAQEQNSGAASTVDSAMSALPADSAQKEKANHKIDVLFIGDSHSVGCFGTTLDNQMRSFTPDGNPRPLNVDSVASCGTSTGNWLHGSVISHCSGGNFRSCPPSRSSCSNDTQSKSGPTEGLVQKLATDQPRMTVVALGTNDMAEGSRPTSINKNTLQTISANALAMVKKIKLAGSKCLWIGPPQETTKFVSEIDERRFVNALRAAVEQNDPSDGQPYCKFVDSTGCSPSSSVAGCMPYTNRRSLVGSDLHYSCKHATTWATSVFEGEIKDSLNRTLAIQIQPTSEKGPVQESGTEIQ